jgi:hypothetical protein
MAQTEGKSQEVAKSTNRLDDDALRSLTNLADIQQLTGETITDASDLGSGFALLDDDGKNRLVGVPCVFISWNINPGDFGPFVSAQVATIDLATGDITGKFIVNDGSTGICEQLTAMIERGKSSMLFAKHGLRRSDYEYADPKSGELRPAHTFYIDTSA